MMQLKLEMARLNHLVNRTFYAKSIIERLQTEEEKIREWSTMKEFDPATSQQIKSILIKHKMEREMVSEQVDAYERAMEKKEREIERI